MCLVVRSPRGRKTMSKRFVLGIFFMLLEFLGNSGANDVVGCGGFVVSSVSINYEPIKIKLYTDRGIIKYISECAPNNGYYFIPLYDHGNYVLRIEPPKGWIFDPSHVELDFDGKNDLCSKQVDINFMFKGFTIFGKVSGMGSTIGPKGVHVTLLSKANNNRIKQNVTTDGGLFEFTEVLPGQYVIEARHDRWKFSKNQIIINVVDDNVNQRDQPDQQLLLWGYSANGKVVSDGRPIRNVQFALYGEKKPPFQLGCDENEPKFISELSFESKNYRFLCHTRSDEQGQFRFDPLPTGKYVVYSHHEAQNIRFEVKPKKYEFEILNDDLDLGIVFEIDGFTVSGQVINGMNPSDIIENVRVKLFDENGKITLAEQQPNGKFTLNNIKTATYVIKTEAEHYQFDDIRLLISPNSAPLPKIIPNKYEVCGKILFKNFEINQQEENNNIEIVIMEKKDIIKDIINLDTENFCFFLPGGNDYLLRLNSKNPDLKFIPNLFELKLDRPRLDLIFEQMTVTLNGLIIFKNSLPNDLDFFTITVTNKNSYRKILKLEDFSRKSEKEYSFKLDNLLPGEYTVTVGGKQNNYFCWEKNEAIVKIDEENNKKNEQIIFRQKGSLLRITLSHETDLLIKSPNGVMIKIGQDSIKNDDRRLVEYCAEEIGKYLIEPSGCHKFSNEKIIFDTETMPGQIISLTALKHLVTSKILTSVNITDLKVLLNVKTNDGELKEETIMIYNGKKSNEYFEYELIFYENPMSQIDIVPHSSQLIFKPAKYSFQLNDDCMPDVVTFYGRPGIFVNGRISQNIPDVTITVYDGETDQILRETKTDNEGKYQAGPFADEINLRIEASKDGFVFKASEEKKGYFEVSKLSSITSTIVDEDGNSLNEVLVSLSGGQNNFRRNSFVDNDGKIAFENLHPGQYFIRFLRKEYEFEPSSKMIDLQNGDNIVLKVVGKKVAFSGFGLVDSLNGEPEPGITVEAVGVRNLAEATSSVQCTQLQEESVSESDGTFRILGLLPDCQYVIRIKLDCLRNRNISKSIPQAHSIRVQDKDLTDLRFIILYKSFQMDLTASLLEIDDEFLSSITVELFRENESSALYKQTLSSPFFFLPPILLDNRTYMLQINSNLDPKLYRYKPETYTFRADRSHMHLELDFKIEQRSQYTGMTDHDIAGMNSVYSIILFLIGLAIYNYQTIQNFFQYRTPGINVWPNVAKNILIASGRQQQQQQQPQSSGINDSGDTSGRKKIKPKKN